MSTFINDFNIFFSGIFSGIQTFWNWFSTTVIGEVILFIVIISVFLFVLSWIIDFKN